ncbi:hypothetical protein SAMN05421881_10989 [Nitrosomonas halophila]|uniref:Uncharacterized protein n=1 Tax=Nitrosomonas halophila TaxID=44576 RepID=A0A1H3PGP1_9PROT|nr:hypothetical protein SAMN05421881_10989 [Nitrosomonas halophila]
MTVIFAAIRCRPARATAIIILVRLLCLFLLDGLNDGRMELIKYCLPHALAYFNQ